MTTGFDFFIASMRKDSNFYVFETETTVPKLAVRFNNEMLGEFALKPEINTIGRLPNNDVCIENLGVSRHHAFLLGNRAESIFILEDLGSLNGTYVNKKRVHKHLLKTGDVITIGQHTLEFLTESIHSLIHPENLRGDEAMLIEKNSSKTYYLQKDKVYLGNSGADDIHIPSLMVGKQFATLSNKGDIWTITLLVQRFSKILLNGEEIQSAILKNDDELEIAGIAFVFKLPQTSA